MKVKLLKRIRKKYQIGINTEGRWCILSKKSRVSVALENSFSFWDAIDRLFKIPDNRNYWFRRMERMSLNNYRKRAKAEYVVNKAKLPQLK